MSEKEDDEGEPEGDYHPLVSVTKIDPAEIPEVPSNRFLYRGGDARPRDGKGDPRERDPKRSRYRDRPDRDYRDYRDNRDSRDSRDNRTEKGKARGTTKSGRVIKGRGVFVSLYTNFYLSNFVHFL